MATFDELKTALDTNRGYRAADSLSMAEAYEEAIMGMLEEPTSASNQSSALGYDAGNLSMLLDRVTSFIAQKKRDQASQNSNASVRILHPSVGWRR